MASYGKKLERLLGEARTRGILNDGDLSALIALSREMDGAGGVGKLATALCFLGALTLLLGIFLLIGANWDGIPDIAKMGLFFLLFFGFHAGGIALRLWRPESRRGTAEALNFIGGGLFLGGLALVSQIYNIHDNPANGVLAWFVATVPMALLLRSPSLTFMAVVAGIVWVNMEIFSGDPSAGLIFSQQVSLPIFLIGIAAGLDRLSHSMGRVCRVMGGLWLAATVYCLGFYHYWFLEMRGEKSEPSVLLLFLPALVGMATLVWLWLKKAYRRREEMWFMILLGSTVLLGLGVVALSLQWLPDGHRYDFFNFGQTSHFYGLPILLSVMAWLLWFAWCLWLVFEGGVTHRGGLVSLGVYGTAFGLISRYFDLLGTMAFTGLAFLVGGIMLLVLGWSAEKWRRRLKNRWM